jgi:N-acetylmuramic acid 6-phosphate etherase
LMAMADALELPGTYGIARDRIGILLAGGAESLLYLAGAPEDDVETARDDARREISAGDCVICVTASGSTPYVLAVADEARALGADVIAVANNADAALFDGAAATILLETPPELVSGSTRMGAGTAQKITLNMMSTLMAVHLGHVHDGFMVNLVADNIKLRKRAANIVSGVSGIAPERAEQHVEAAEGSVKTAILLALGVRDKSEAEAILNQSGANVRRALKVIGQ